MVGGGGSDPGGGLLVSPGPGPARQLGARLHLMNIDDSKMLQLKTFVSCGDESCSAATGSDPDPLTDPGGSGPGPDRLSCLKLSASTGPLVSNTPPGPENTKIHSTTAENTGSDRPEPPEQVRTSRTGQEGLFI